MIFFFSKVPTQQHRIIQIKQALQQIPVVFYMESLCSCVDSSCVIQVSPKLQKLQLVLKYESLCTGLFILCVSFTLINYDLCRVYHSSHLMTDGE